MTEESDIPAADDAGLIDNADQDTPAAEAPQLDQTTLEAVASKFGWKADGELDAAAFLDRTPQIIQRDRSKLKSLGKVVQGLESRLTGTKKSEIAAKIAKAVESGDETAAQKIADEVVDNSSAVQAEYADFMARNAEWYEEDPEATAYVLALDKQYSTTLGTRDPVKHFEAIEKAVRRRFPEHFPDAPPAKETKKEAKTGQPFVHGASRVSKAAPTQKTAATLTTDERKAAKDMGVTPESYAESLNEYRAQQGKAA